MHYAFSSICCSKVRSKKSLQTSSTSCIKILKTNKMLHIKTKQNKISLYFSDNKDCNKKIDIMVQLLIANFVSNINTNMQYNNETLERRLNIPVVLKVFHYLVFSTYFFFGSSNHYVRTIIIISIAKTKVS